MKNASFQFRRSGVLPGRVLTGSNNGRMNKNATGSREAGEKKKARIKWQKGAENGGRRKGARGKGAKEGNAVEVIDNNKSLRARIESLCLVCF